MTDQDVLVQEILLKIIKNSNDINNQILTRKINDIVSIKRHYLILKKNIEDDIPKNLLINHECKPVNCLDILTDEIEKFYTISINFFRNINWGDFSKLNRKLYPELFEMMLDKNGELLRTYDNFNGTVAVMDFHGYTQFSNDVKYNKTPLIEFGSKLPQKIDHICRLCKTIVYESEGDMLILIGPENPIYILEAVLSIIELTRQKPLIPYNNPQTFHGLEIKNPMIKPFEMTAAITTGGETYINQKGSIIGTIISEASRMLKVINLKKISKSGVLLNEKVFRKIEKYKDTKTKSHFNIQDFKTSSQMLIDVKGMRLNIRELFLDEKNYSRLIELNSVNLIEEIKKKNPSKWFNIFTYYIKLVLSAINDSKFVIKIGYEEYHSDKLKLFLGEMLSEWVKEPTADTINSILRISNVLFNSVEEVRDAIAFFYEYVNENFSFISDNFENYYKEILKNEEKMSANFRKAIDNYNSEIKKIKTRVPPRRILETILSDINTSEHIQDIPYIGKK